MSKWVYGGRFKSRKESDKSLPIRFPIKTALFIHVSD